MNSTQNMLLPLLQYRNSTSTMVKEEMKLYEFKLDFVTVINVAFIVLLAACYIFYTFKYVKVVRGSTDSLSRRKPTRGQTEKRSIEDGSAPNMEIQLSEVINPLSDAKASSSFIAGKGVKNPVAKMESRRKL